MWFACASKRSAGPLIHMGVLLDRFGPMRPILSTMALAIVGILLMLLLVRPSASVWMICVGYIVSREKESSCHAVRRAANARIFAKNAHKSTTSSTMKATWPPRCVAAANAALSAVMLCPACATPRQIDMTVVPTAPASCWNVLNMALPSGCMLAGITLMPAVIVFG